MKALIVAALLGLALLGFVPGEAQACTAPGCTKIIDNGPDAGKKVVVVMGDGYTSAEQATYNTQVGDLVTDGMFGHDFFEEMHNAFNVYRLNLNSVQSGVSQRTWDLNGTPNDSDDDTLVSTSMKNTALRYIFNGVWSHCWLEHDGGNTNTRKNNALAANGLSHADYVIVILNEPGFGGCNRGPRDIVQTRSIGWPVVGHEAGHGIGGLMDEYTAGGGAYKGGAINNRNCSTVLNRNTVFWNRFISPATPVPTTFGAGMDSNRTVGMFAGCRYKSTGIYRPVHNCRMRGNTPNFCPVCQTLMRENLHPNLAHNFLRAVAGDFNGDGRDDVLVQNSNDWAIYRAGTGPRRLDRVWTANNRVPGKGGWYGWPIRSGDRLHVADFTGDGKDDILVLNTTSWLSNWVVLLESNGTGLETVTYSKTLSGYGTVGDDDELHVADFDGDGKDDVYLFSSASWGTRYLGMLKSHGSYLQGVRRYDNYVPGWSMRKNDRYHVGDLDGDGKDDLYVFNGNDWSYRYLGMLRSGGTSLANAKLYTTSLPGWTMTSGDRFFVGDHNGDGKDDLYVFNGSNWCCAYLLMARSTGSGLAYVKRYNDGSGDANNIPGWQMRKGDRFWISDANKDGKDDLFVYNPKINWGHEYLGTLRSSGGALAGSWSEDWVLGIPGAGGWNLGSVDQILPVNYEGGAGTPDLFIRNKDWFGLIRRDPVRFVMDRHYRQWIYSPLHDSKPWQIGMP
jgi:hypothetical protein